MSAFARFPARLQEAIVSRLGWTSLRPVQELAGEAILDGKNAVVLAPTAGGKTEASMLPAIANMVEREPDGVGVIYVAPIKALLNNQEERLGTYTEMVGLRRFVWHGDVSDAAKRKFVREPAEILMTTPESLEVMLVSPRSPVQRLFKDLRLVVIDEVHALAGTDRGAHLMSVIERLAPSSANDVQRVGLSATVGNPDEILGWLRGSSRRDGAVIDPPKQPARRDLSVVLHTSTAGLAADAAARATGRKSLFFCQSRALTETVADRMRGSTIDVFAHHSSVSLEERRAAEARFAHGTNACIVCTSTLELGIDVGDLDLVFQANAPSTVSSFMQRMGRTGRRAGTTANTAFLCEEPEAVLQAVALIELAREGWIERVPQQERCWPVLVHQLLAMTLQFGAVSAERVWEQLSRVPDFRGISRAELDLVIAHMLAEEFTQGSRRAGRATTRGGGRKRGRPVRRRGPAKGGTRAMGVSYTANMSSAGKRRPARSFEELWDELLDVPEGFIGEIVDGEVIETIRPRHPHTIATSDLQGLLAMWFRFGIGGPGGWVILHEPAIRFGDELRIPDLAGWRADQFVAPDGSDPYVVAPDWICEALSPTTEQVDRAEKLPLYARHGVRHVWLVDAIIQTLEVFRLEAGRWVQLATHGGGARVRAEPFDAVELDLAMVWGPPRPPAP